MVRLLIRSLGKEFYQQHAGFFFVGFYFLFGVVEPSQLLGYHKSLLIAGISSPLGIALVCGSWLLYSIKVYFFIQQKADLPEYKFLSTIGSLDTKRQLRVSLKLFVFILLPVLTYVVLLVGFSIGYLHLGAAIIFITVFLILCLCLSWLSFRNITYGFLKSEWSVNERLSKIEARFVKPFFSWPIFHLFNEQPLMLIVCKFSSFILFKGILWMFADQPGDLRVLLMALLASVLSHAIVVIDLLKFEAKYLNFTSSMPFNIGKRYLNWLITFALILIPEWIIFAISVHFTLVSVFCGLVFGLSGMSFLLIVLLAIELDTERYFKWLLFYFSISMMAILSGYYIIFSIVLAAGCFLFYRFSFDTIDLRGVEEEDSI
jgi:hypothetical protein